MTNLEPDKIGAGGGFLKQKSDWPGRLRVAGAALAGAALSLYFFTPRFTLWRLLGFEITVGDTPSEVSRAGDALAQMQHPLAAIENVSNRVLEWRLLFPGLGHLLHLPDALYLALPHLGAIAALWFFAGVLRRRGLTWGRIVASTTILASSSWFFVSMGWLGYFDSWYIAALLVVVFANSERAAAFTILAGPWIDERFALTLPLALLLRAWDMREFVPKGTPFNRRQFIHLGCALLPWIAVRSWAVLSGHDSVSGPHALHMQNAHQVLHASSYAAGLWEGVRWGWLVVAALVFDCWRKSPAWGGLLVAVTGITMGVNLAVAEDLSRSAAVIVPAIALGLAVLRGPSLMGGTTAIAVVAALNLLTPARHVLGDHRIPIFYLPAEMHRNDDYLADFSARSYMGEGISLAGRGDREVAVKLLSLAVRLDPENVEALARRAVLHAQLTHWELAMADLDTALDLNKELPDLWLNRGELRARAGDRTGAASDVREAIARAPKDWSRANEAKSVLDSVSR